MKGSKMDINFADFRRGVVCAFLVVGGLAVNAPVFAAQSGTSHLAPAAQSGTSHRAECTLESGLLDYTCRN